LPPKRDSGIIADSGDEEGCPDTYTDGEGNTYYVERGNVYGDWQTKVYKLVQGNAYYIPGFELLRYLTLYFDTGGNDWYGTTQTATSNPTSGVSDTQALYEISFSTSTLPLTKP
jgi:hypothetical protein